MTSNCDNEAPARAVIGNKDNFWLYDSETGFDLTHPPTPTSPIVIPSLKIETTTSPITVDPAKSALVIIDMQNFFLSSAFGRTRGAGHAALDQLVNHAIPAAREAGLRIIWLNWGLTEDDVDSMPPGVSRAFGFKAEANGQTVTLDKHGRPGRSYTGPGNECGSVHDPASGQTLDAGRLLMRGQWNSALYAPLDDVFAAGKTLPARPDVWLHKNRMSGLVTPDTECATFLEQEGITSLFFAGVNTDQCVGGTLQDAFSAGYDCVLLRDGCGTTSPRHAQECVEFNAAGTWGFSISCEALAEGVRVMGTK